jgi:hypothetical protein
LIYAMPATIKAGGIALATDARIGPNTGDRDGPNPIPKLPLFSASV